MISRGIFLLLPLLLLLLLLLLPGIESKQFEKKLGFLGFLLSFPSWAFLQMLFEVSWEGKIRNS